MSDGALPVQICWTKSGPESGMKLSEIVRAKENQRLESGGVFLWGIGSSVGPSIRELVVSTPEPMVVFTRMRSNPAMRDVDPCGVGRWMSAVDLAGAPYEMPPGAQVTSGLHRAQGQKRHWALVCERGEPLPVDSEPQQWVYGDAVRNLRSGKPVGSSQVTSIVRRASDAESANRYPVLFTARLVWPYQVTLSDCRQEHPKGHM